MTEDSNPNNLSVENSHPGIEPEQRHGFEPTHWSLVLAAVRGDEPRSIEALEQLCRAYWPPIYAHVRMQGHNVHDAQDLAQEFFARLLRGPSLAGVTPEKGRFRSFLLGAVKHFLINEWKRSNTLKRGGGLVFVNLDALEPGVREACEPRSGEDPETAYERRWALTLLARVRERLQREYEAAGLTERHAALKGYLTEGDAVESYAATAEQLGITESAVKSAIYKLRQRFGLLLRAEIARTVASNSEVDEELRHLIDALRR